MTIPPLPSRTRASPDCWRSTSTARFVAPRDKSTAMPHIAYVGLNLLPLRDPQGLQHQALFDDVRDSAVRALQAAGLGRFWEWLQALDSVSATLLGLAVAALALF